MDQVRVDALLKEAREMVECLEDGEALYYHGDDLIYGRDGCQPSGSICISTFDEGENIDWQVLEEMLLARD